MATMVNANGKPTRVGQRSIVFAVGACLLLVAFRSWLLDLARFALHHGEYSHILVLPWAAAIWMVWRRDVIVAETEWALGLGSLLLLFGGMTYGIARRNLTRLNQNDQLALMTFSLVVLLIGTFTSVYGIKALRRTAMPLVLLGFSIPIPSFLMEKIVRALQIGSAEVTYRLYQVALIPVLRHGVTFDLPGIRMEIAKECSSIRSTSILFLTAILAAQRCLSTARARVLLVLATLPISVLRNGLRIFLLSTLAIYVDRSFLTGTLHHEGGILFFAFALTILAAVLRFLQKWEGSLMSGRQRMGKEPGLPRLGQGSTVKPSMSTISTYEKKP